MDSSKPLARRGPHREVRLTCGFRALCFSFIVLFFIASLGCGGGSQGGQTPPPPPPPSPQVPTVLWPGDAFVSTTVGDNGVTSTQPPGVVIVADGSGGAFVVWEDDVNGVVRVQHLDSSGKATFASGGIRVAAGSPYQTGPVAISDAAGGMIVAWVDGRAGACGYFFKGSCDIYAQRFDSSGNSVWALDGIAVVNAPENQGISGISIAADTHGGAFVAWEDARSCCTIYAHHIDENGQFLWPINGVQVSPSPSVVTGAISRPPIILSDGSGGALVSWWNIQVIPLVQPPTVNVQKLDANGALQWGTDGIRVALHLLDPDDSGQIGLLTMVSDGSGGVIIGGVDNQPPGSQPAARAVVQRINSSGQNMWGPRGVALTQSTRVNVYPILLSDGTGGAFVAWQECDQVGSPNCDIFAQRVNSPGQLVWGSSGIAVVAAAGIQAAHQLTTDGRGGVYVTWVDCRAFPYPAGVNDCYFGMDLYGQRLNNLGQVLWEKNGFPISAAGNNQGVPYTTIFLYPGYSVALDGQNGLLLAWPDGRNNYCFSSSLDSRCELRAQRIKP